MVHAVGTTIGFLLVLVITLVFCLLLGLPTMLLWNWLMPPMFGVKKINLLRATGLLCLGGLLFHGSSDIFNVVAAIGNETVCSFLPPEMQSKIRREVRSEMA